MLHCWTRRPQREVVAPEFFAVGIASTAFLPGSVKGGGENACPKNNTIRLGLSNASIEATNNKIKLVIRKAYGFRNVDNMIDLIYLVCSDLELPLPNRKSKTRPAA